MVDKDIVMEKAGNIRRCLSRINDTTQNSPDSLFDIDIQDIFVLNLQRAIQSALDLAAHIIADDSLGFPTTLREHFQILAQENIITHDLSQSMQAMVGFRNIAVHEYQNIEVAILQGILKNHLSDLENFYQSIFDYYRII